MLSRRELLAGGVALAAGSVVAAPPAGATKCRRPKPLKAGDRVALVAPAGADPAPESWARAEEAVRMWGLEPVLFPNVGQKYGYLAGTDEVRAADFNQAFADKSIAGVICLRGGYGAMRMLDLVDWKMVRRNPKVLMGYSDITALLIAAQKKSGIVTYHGPVSGWPSSDFSSEWMERVVFGYDALDLPNSPEHTRESIVGGVAEGPLTGGNLTLVAHLMGTPYQPDFKGRILFLEDIGEAPYRIDRMLTHLELAGVFRTCAGVILGQFTERDDSEKDSEWSTAFVVRERLKRLKIPVAMGFSIGHVKNKVTLPLGAMARLDADALTLRLL